MYSVRIIYYTNGFIKCATIRAGKSKDTTGGRKTSEEMKSNQSTKSEKCIH